MFMLALTACAPPSAPAPTAAAQTQAPAPIVFRAIGQEPGWRLEIGDTIDLLYRYGEARATLPAAAPDISQDGVTRYAASNDAHTMTIVVTPAPCEDAMSGQPYPARVTVVIDGETLEGCGGPP